MLIAFRRDLHFKVCIIATRSTFERYFRMFLTLVFWSFLGVSTKVSALVFIFRSVYRYFSSAKIAFATRLL